MSKIFIVEDKPALMRNFISRWIDDFAESEKEKIEVSLLVPLRTDKENETTKMKKAISMLKEMHQDECREYDGIEERFSLSIDIFEYTGESLYDAEEDVMRRIKDHVMPDGVLKGMMLVDLVLQDPEDRVRLTQGNYILSHKFVEDPCLRDFCIFYTRNLNEVERVMRLWEEMCAFNVQAIRRNIDGYSTFPTGFINEVYELAEKAVAI